MHDQQPTTSITTSREQKPDIAHLLTLLQGPLDVRSLALSVLVLLALFYTLYVARAVFLPITIALFLSFLLRPLVQTLTRLYIPTALGAALVLVIGLGVIGYGISWLAAPAAQWMDELPRNLRQIEWKLHPVKESVEQVNKATEQVGNLAQMNNAADAMAVKVQVERPGVFDFVLNQTLRVLTSVVVTVILLYFLLASGNLFLYKLVRVLPSLTDKKIAVSVVSQIEHDLSRYIATITMINAGLAVAVMMAMAWLRMPNPILWGVMAGSFNFIPYLGAIASTTVLSLVALITFNGIWQALLVPVVFVVLTCLEGFIVTPTIVGRRLALNPVVIFVGLIFWGWLWGIAGALLAVQLLVAFKVICDHVKPFMAIGEFLSD